MYIYICIYMYIYIMSLVSELLLPCVNQLLYGKCKRSTASSLRFPGSKRDPSGSQGIAQIWERCISWEKAKSWATRRCRWQCLLMWYDVIAVIAIDKSTLHTVHSHTDSYWFKLHMYCKHTANAGKSWKHLEVSWNLNLHWGRWSGELPRFRTAFLCMTSTSQTPTAWKLGSHVFEKNALYVLFT